LLIPSTNSGNNDFANPDDAHTLFVLPVFDSCVQLQSASNTTLHVPIPDDSWAQNPAQPSTGLCEAPGVMSEPDGPLASNPTQPPYGLRVPPYAPTEPLRPQPHAFLHI
jgi:hypothetical protein